MNSLRTINSLRQSGFSMIEILVTLVILLVGLLGLAGLQMQAQRAEMESYQRVQALVLLQDITERINANSVNYASYVVASVGTGDTVYAAPDCTTKSSMALRDLCEWSNALQGASEQQSGGGSVGAMVGARGCITSPAASSVIASVAWQGLGDTTAPAAGDTCGLNQYVSEKKRRVISLPLSIGCLSCP